MNEAASQFGRYILHRLIAEGGMAEVFLAEQRGAEDFSKIVALKRMLPHLSRQPEFVTMFLDEARLASRMSHPNVVQVFDFGEVETRYFLAMEYLAGECLASIQTKAKKDNLKLPLPIILQLMIGACDGLHYAHSFSDRGQPLNLVHRDVSPSNIMVTYQGGIKLLDFGIARALDRRQERTETGVVKGKIPYCSPEQLQCEDLDRRSDIFSLGVVFHELLTGARLFKKETEFKTVSAVMTQPILPPSAQRPELPPEVDWIVGKALRRNPDERHQTVLELRRDIEQLVQGQPVRLDEFMLNLFGEDYISEHINLSSSISRVPTSRDAVMGSVLGGEEATSSLRRRESPPLLTAQVRLSPVPTVDAPQALRPLQRRSLWFGMAAVLGVLVAAVGSWAVLRSSESNSPTAEGKRSISLARLMVDSVPRGASVEICGQRLPNTTPTSAPDGLPAGECTVIAKAEGHEPASQVVRLEAGAHQSVLLRLAPSPAVVEVEAPDGAQLWIDAENLGTARRATMEPGEHRVGMTLAGHAPFEVKLNLSPGELRRISPRLTKKTMGTGSLDVSCVPWCRVFVNGKDVGRPSPIVGLKLAAGNHALKLEHPPSGRSRELTVQIKSGQTVRETASFR